jgi:dCTP diphosphatase
MNDDHTTTVAELKAAVGTFVAERDWQQFHDPKSLVMALASEVGELADHFRWLTNEQSRDVAVDPEHAEAIAHELADIMMFAVEFAAVCEIDIASAITAKLEINEARYPVAKAKGSNRKYDRL